jgi:hypothetical protein
MAALTHAQEYAAVREAIQTLTATGSPAATVVIDGISITYQASQLVSLQQREEVLARRLTIRNVRKRTASDFTG